MAVLVGVKLETIELVAIPTCPNHGGWERLPAVRTEFVGTVAVLVGVKLETVSWSPYRHWGPNHGGGSVTARGADRV